MMYFPLFLFSFGALYFGWPFCVYMGCTDTDFCMYDICGLWTVFVVLYFWICVYGYVYGCAYGHVFGYVFGFVFMAMCMGIGPRSSARPGSTNIGAYLSLGPVSIIIGTYSSTKPIWMTPRNFFFQFSPDKNGKICPSI